MPREIVRCLLISFSLILRWAQTLVRSLSHGPLCSLGPVQRRHPRLHLTISQTLNRSLTRPRNAHLRWEKRDECINASVKPGVNSPKAIRKNNLLGSPVLAQYQSTCEQQTGQRCLALTPLLLRTKIGGWRQLRSLRVVISPMALVMRQPPQAGSAELIAQNRARR